MNFVDIIIFLLIIASGFRGTEVGFVRQLGSLVGLCLGIALGGWLSSALNVHGNIAIILIVGFVIIGVIGGEFLGLKLKVVFHDNKINVVTLFYFAWFAFISGIMLGAAVLPWWITTFGIIGIAGGCIFVIWHFASKSKVSLVLEEAKPKLFKTILLIGLGTAAQLFFITLAYYIELKSVNPSVSIGQVISYTGAANFALFVSITPGAIGIREAFLLFSQQIHGISTASITAASILDRAIYFVVLGLLGILVLATHASKKFTAKAHPDEAQ